MIKRVDVEGGLLLLDAQRGCLFAFNESAAVVWELMDAGQFDQALIEDFASAWNIPVSRAGADVDGLLSEWRKIGILRDPTAGRSMEGAIPSEVVEAAGPRSSEAVKAWTCTIRDRGIAFAIEGDAASVIYPMFRHLETPGAVQHVRFEVREVDGDRQALFENGRERITTSDLAQLIGAIWQAVLEAIHPHVRWLALIHGGAVGRRGIATGLCGPSGSGKSTLVAALTSVGFDYLADDMITLSRPHGEIVPLPLPQSIKPGSLDVLNSTHPDLAGAEVYLTKGMNARLLVPAASVWEADPMPLRTLIFPRFKDGQPASTRALSTFEAVRRLLNERIWLGYPMTQESVSSFVAWLSSTPCHAIEFGNVEDSIALVEDILR